MDFEPLKGFARCGRCEIAREVQKSVSIMLVGNNSRQIMDWITRGSSQNAEESRCDVLDLWLIRSLPQPALLGLLYSNGKLVTAGRGLK
jgi:hypothetical protein